MSTFCSQCQATGCTTGGSCNKNPEVANLQNLVIYTLKGILVLSNMTVKYDINSTKVDEMLMTGLFMTVTNANFNKDNFIGKIKEAVKIRDEIKLALKEKGADLTNLPDAATWNYDTDVAIEEKSHSLGVDVLAAKNEDTRSLRELITSGVKGMAAYAEHAHNLGYDNIEILSFIKKALSATMDDSLTADDLVALTLETGKFGVEEMSILDFSIWKR